MIPLFHDLSDEAVLIFGGGPVGARRARAFGEEARVIVVSPEFVDEGFGGAELIHEAPTAGDLPAWIERTAPALVIAATDDEGFNAAVERAARDAGVPVNRADTNEGDVIVPAMIRDDPVVAAVSTGGRSPALSAELRRRIEAELQGAGALAEVTAELREELRGRGLPAETRREVLRAVVESDRVWAGARWSEAEAREAARKVVDGALDGEG